MPASDQQGELSVFFFSAIITPAVNMHGVTHSPDGGRGGLMGVAGLKMRRQVFVLTVDVESVRVFLRVRPSVVLAVRECWRVHAVDCSEEPRPPSSITSLNVVNG